MIKIDIFDGTKTYVAPGGDLLTPEVMGMKYGGIYNFKHMIQTDEDGEICYAVQLFSAMKNQMGIDPSLSETDAITEMETILNAEPPVPEPTAEERMAAAMEYQNLLTL